MHHWTLGRVGRIDCVKAIPHFHLSPRDSVSLPLFHAYSGSVKGFDFDNPPGVALQSSQIVEAENKGVAAHATNPVAGTEKNLPSLGERM